MPEIQYLRLHKQILTDFWTEFGGAQGRRGLSIKSKDETITALVRIGSIELKRSPKARTAAFNRRQYVNHKRKLWGYNGFVLCFACGSPAQCRHHIIWIRNGGRNHKRNIVALCNDCHALIHPWLRLY